MEKKVYDHPFQRAGLGEAPFRCFGVATLPPKSMAGSNPEGYNNALRGLPHHIGLGTCHYCGHAIMTNFLIRSSDGKEFAVGCDCVWKTDDAKLVTETKAIQNKIARDKARELRDRRWEDARQKRIADRERKLQEEKDRNGGLTDEEVKRASEEIEIQKKLVVLGPLADQMRDGKGGFRDSVANDLMRGRVPRGGGLGIMLEILAKQKGRSGSKLFLEEHERLEALLSPFC